jgi:hypothetical protein
MISMTLMKKKTKDEDASAFIIPELPHEAGCSAFLHRHHEHLVHAVWLNRITASGLLRVVFNPKRMAELGQNFDFLFGCCRGWPKARGNGCIVSGSGKVRARMPLGANWTLAELAVSQSPESCLSAEIQGILQSALTYHDNEGCHHGRHRRDRTDFSPVR